MTAVLTLDGVHAGYQSTEVLHGLSLRVEPGQIVALLGRNGAGKTTALLSISGFVKVARGEITVCGRSTRGRRQAAIARLGVAHVPESRALFRQMSVRDNLVVAGASTRRGFDAAYALFPELRALESRRAGLLSGGEQQMLALARAVVQQPRLLMVDEMSLGLAPIICERLSVTLRALAERGVGVLLVEQHLRLALSVADYAYVIRRGQVALEGTASTLRDLPEQVKAAYLPGTTDPSPESSQESIPEQILERSLSHGHTR